MCSEGSNILPDLIFYCHHSSWKKCRRISEKQNCRRKKEATHVVERRRNTGKITEASLTRREKLWAQQLNLAGCIVYSNMCPIKKQDNKTTDGCLVGREEVSRWCWNNGGNLWMDHLKYQAWFQALAGVELIDEITNDECLWWVEISDSWLAELLSEKLDVLIKGTHTMREDGGCEGGKTHRREDSIHFVNLGPKRTESAKQKHSFNSKINFVIIS